MGVIVKEGSIDSHQKMQTSFLTSDNSDNWLKTPNQAFKDSRPRSPVTVQEWVAALPLPPSPIPDNEDEQPYFDTKNLDPQQDSYHEELQLESHVKGHQLSTQ